MTNKLQQYFPMIRTREEVLNEIESKSRLKNLFYEWTEENQNEFLDFCTGVKGIKIMYDFMIKGILNPENTLERVNELLTLLLGQRVRIVDVLPNDGTRLADERFLLQTWSFNWKTEVLRIWKFRKSDIIFREKEAHVIRQICCCGSIRGQGESKESGFLTEISSRYIRSCYSKKVQPNFRNFPIITSIVLCRNLIQE